MITENHSYTNTSRTTWHIEAVPQFAVNRSIAHVNFSYWTHQRALSMECWILGNRKTTKLEKTILSLIQYPTSNSGQDQMLQTRQKIHIWVDFLLYLGGDLFLGAVSSAPVKLAVQLLSLSLSIQNPKSEGPIP